MIRNVGVLMNQFNMDQFNDTPLSPLDGHPACPTCGSVLAHLQTVSSSSVPLRFFFEFSVFHCPTHGLFYRTRPSTDGPDTDFGVRVPRKQPPDLTDGAVALSEPSIHFESAGHARP